jgi:hypothetical protein
MQNSPDQQSRLPVDRSDLPHVPRRIIVYAVAGLSLAAILGYVGLSLFALQGPETLINIALTGIGILGGMAMPQDG